MKARWCADDWLFYSGRWLLFSSGICCTTVPQRCHHSVSRLPACVHLHVASTPTNGGLSVGLMGKIRLYDACREHSFLYTGDMCNSQLGRHGNDTNDASDTNRLQRRQQAPPIAIVHRRRSCFALPVDHTFYGPGIYKRIQQCLREYILARQAIRIRIHVDTGDLLRSYLAVE